MSSIRVTQNYFGDEKVVPQLLGKNGKHIRSFFQQHTITLSHPNLINFHWDVEGQFWQIRAGSASDLDIAVKWLLEREFHFAQIFYKQAQTDSLGKIRTETVITQSLLDKVSANAKSEGHPFYASTTPARSDDQNWRNHTPFTTDPMPTSSEWDVPSSEWWR